MEASILVKSSSRDEPYTVIISKTRQGLSIHCNCGAGEQGKFCKHKRAVAAGDASILYDAEQTPAFQKAMRWLNKSDYPQLIDDLAVFEEELEAGKTMVKDTKASLARNMRDGLK
jgi:hypothetical protein